MSQRKAMAAIAKAAVPKLTDKQRYERYIRDVEGLLAHDATIPDVQVFDMDAVSKPRMSSSDRWKKRDVVLFYRAYCDELRAKGAKLPYAYRLEFVIEMPKSWPEPLKVALDGKPHLLVPDASNLCKAVEDALVPQDSVIHNQGSTKRWGRTPSITIRKATAFN